MLQSLAIENWVVYHVLKWKLFYRLNAMCIKAQHIISHHELGKCLHHGIQIELRYSTVTFGFLDVLTGIHGVLVTDLYT
jgi:hypothetical protein